MNALIARLSATNQRALALILLVAAAVLVIGAMLVPIYLLHRHYDTAIASMSDRLERYHRVAAQAPQYQKALESMRQKDGRRFFLKNTAANLSGAELQEYLRAAIDNYNARLTTSQILANRDDGRFKQISVTVQFFANSQNLQKILFQLETQVPYLTVENLTVRPLNAFRGFRPAAGHEPDMNIQLDAAGYMLMDAERAGDKTPEGARK